MCRRFFPPAKRERSLPFDHHSFRNHAYAVFRHRESPTVSLQVIANDLTSGNFDTLIDDGAADPGVTADFHVVEHNAVLDVGPAMDEDAGPQN